MVQVFGHLLLQLGGEVQGTGQRRGFKNVDAVQSGFFADGAAMWSVPLATSTGAPSPEGSYSSATAKCSGLVMITSASLMRFIMRALAI